MVAEDRVSPTLKKWLRLNLTAMDICGTGANCRRQSPFGYRSEVQTRWMPIRGIFYNAFSKDRPPLEIKKREAVKKEKRVIFILW